MVRLPFLFVCFWAKTPVPLDTIEINCRSRIIRAPSHPVNDIS